MTYNHDMNQTSIESATKLKSREEHAALTVNECLSRVTPIWPLESVIAVNPLARYEVLPFSKAMEKASLEYHSIPLLPQKFATQEEPRGACWNFGDIGKGLTTLEFLAIEQNEIVKEADQEVCTWISHYLDQNQATLSFPMKSLGFWRGWRTLQSKDRVWSIRDMTAEQKVIVALPDSSTEACVKILVELLGLPAESIAGYVTRLLIRLQGWHGVARQQTQDTPDKNLASDLLAVHLAYEWAYAQAICRLKFNSSAGYNQLLKLIKEEKLPFECPNHFKPSLEAIHQRLVALEKAESLYRSKLKADLVSSWHKQSTETNDSRPNAQGIFCIDVRSEGLRRQLESLIDIETFGFAGFFGVALDHKNNGHTGSQAQCPVLLSPAYKSSAHSTVNNIMDSVIRGVALLLKPVKSSPLGAFAFVETFGAFYAPLIAARSAATRYFRKKYWAKKKQQLAQTSVETNLSIDDKSAIAKGALSAMGLTKNFAPWVFVCGHGSEAVNNAFASAYDCGACGGRNGDPNATVFANILNDQEVRKRLAESNIHIPQDTRFIPARHNTTTDEIIPLIDVQSIEAKDLQEILVAFKKASELNNREKLARFTSMTNSSSKESAKEMAIRASCWSETRPEWGLAGNACFIVGSRKITKKLNLETRSFLHSYDWTIDEKQSFKALEVILTAPLIVAQWINHQYFFSASAPELFSSGNKLIQNITGGTAVVEGNTGDLRAGLPLQAVRYGDRLLHQPLRLYAVVEAPRTAIDAVIKNHDGLRYLLSNHWIHMLCLDPTDRQAYEYDGKCWIQQ